MKTKEMQQIDVAGNWTNLLFLEHLITGVIFSETAPCSLERFGNGTNYKRVTEMSKDL